MSANWRSREDSSGETACPARASPPIREIQAPRGSAAPRGDDFMAKPRSIVHCNLTLRLFLLATCLGVIVLTGNGMGQDGKAVTGEDVRALQEKFQADRAAAE